MRTVQQKRNRESSKFGKRDCHPSFNPSVTPPPPSPQTQHKQCNTLLRSIPSMTTLPFFLSLLLILSNYKQQITAII
ncbi:hypothetical protein DFA_03399 [Cavenderia fasciculata]|uniref:Uncharacterized protein n=1 Tax=Cavenderia fasciculata TaxID=261658 RepID=F4PHG7_CACFS|nr:uncharacterized protein DFA_03399 [Cavenderia fasciculata]EGG25151.1 hypothetical protein DFA_03399 [Cavenderia fasciculata]|eukprot:XP_004363002.1 hypothetical protein DFA_03399 [Cavenderia fasciculata]